MEEALRILEKNKPYPTDEAFIFQVKLHLLTQRAAHIREQNEVDRARIATTAATAASVPAVLYLRSLQKQLHDLREALSPGLKQQGKLSHSIITMDFNANSMQTS